MTNSRTISHGELRGRLAELVTGPVLGAGDPAYEQSRRAFNAMIDRRPAAIVQCTSAGDVARAVTLAREYDLPISVKGGGHSVAGNAVSDDGLMLDMSSMNRISVDPKRGLAVAEAGEEGSDRVRDAYGINYDRLADIKAACDPDNVFRLNQNIRPSGGAAA